MRTIKVITLCSGYDAQCLGLRRAGIPFDLVAWSDIDPTAIAAHNALFPEYEDRNLKDMTKIKWQNKDFGEIDLLTYSTPCTDISVAGEKKGFEEGSGTRSAILWHTKDAIKRLRPKYLLQENVKTIITGNNKALFEKWANAVEKLGYKNYWQILDAVDFGVPQSRKRLFMVSVRNDIEKPYIFPVGKPLMVRCFDWLDDVYKSRLDHKENETIRLNYNDHVNGYVGIRCMEFRAYDVRGVFPCVTASFLPLLAIPFDATAEKYWIPEVNGIDRVEVDKKCWCYRYMTAREMLRFMGLKPDEQDAIIETGLTRSNINLVAGNSIVVQVMQAIFSNMFPKQGRQMTLF